MILHNRQARWLLAPAAVLLLVFFLLPLIYFTIFSFLPSSTTGLAGDSFTLSNYVYVLTDPFIAKTITNTVLIAASATVLTLVLALPVARFMTKSPAWLKGLLIVLAIFPLLTGSVVRSIGWVAILGYSGIVNSIFIGLGITEEPLELLQTPQSIVLVMATIVLPAMILVLHAGMEGVDAHSERAALTLGSNPSKAFWNVVVPQIIPAIVTGTSLVFVMCVNAYSVPVLIGGSRVAMMSPQIYEAMSTHGNLPRGAAMSVVIVLISLTIVTVFGWLMSRIDKKWRGAIS